MKAIVINRYGSFDELKYEEMPMPKINDNQVLVRNYATSVNHLEIKKAAGAMKERMPLQFPWIPGHDFAGIVEMTGKKVHHLQAGDRVYGNMWGGSYAQFLAADIDKVAAMPEDMPFIEASSVPHVAETAWQALYKHGRLQKGETVLIHGGAGAVGMFAVQFARITGAKVLTTTTGNDMQFARQLGADKVIDFQQQNFTKEFNDVDLVLSLVGGETELKSYSVLKKGGRLISTVGISYPDAAREKGVDAGYMVIEQSAADLNKITALFNVGKVVTDVGLVLPLQEAAQGWKALTGDRSVPHPSHGKIVLDTK